MPRTDPLRNACFRSLWQRNRGVALFMIGPALGLWLVNAIFSFPRALWISAGGMALLMIGLFFYLVWQDFKRHCRPPRLNAEQNH